MEKLEMPTTFALVLPTLDSSIINALVNMDSIWIKGNALRPVLLTRLLYRPVFAAFVMRTRFSKEPAVFVTLQVFGGEKVAKKRLSVPKNYILFSPEV
jgi:hypothetical protein